MDRGTRLLCCLLLLRCVSGLPAGAQGTKLWSVGRFDEMQRGTPEGIAIRSDGRLEPGLATSLVYSSDRSYLWSVAAAPSGESWIGTGGSTANSAQIYRVAADGRAERVFEGKELGVQALRFAADGSLLAATSPDGRVVRLRRGNAPAETIFDSASTAEKPKYLWDLAAGPKGEVYVAAGAPAAVYRILASGGAPELLFKTADQHIRCLLLAPDGMLWAGTDGSGIVYRFDTVHPGARPFAVYAATRREITALARDSAGNLYAAGVGSRSGNTLPPLPATGNVGVTVTFVQPGSTSAAGSNSLLPEGSEIYRIAVDGTPQRLVTLRDDVVYALAVRSGAGGERLLIGTGNRGRIYTVDPALPGLFTEAARLEASQATAFTATPTGLLVGTSNGGKLFRVEDAVTRLATYTSEVFDAQILSRWGRVEAQFDPSGSGQPGFTLAVRTGNVPNPAFGWSDWAEVRPNEPGTRLTPGRYAQWRATLRPGGNLVGVGLNYLARNIAPMVDEIVVAPGARVSPQIGAVPANATVQVVLPGTGGVAQAISLAQESGNTPLTAQRDRTGITVRWSAHDDNGDDLMFAVLYRGTGEQNWHLLKDHISDRFFSFDSALLPDGSYTLKVQASDAPDHTDADTLTGEHTGAPFTIDTTPPVPGALTARLEPGSPARIHATLEAHDSTSPIAHAEYSVDAGPWQYLEPVGGLSDSLSERFDFLAPIPAPTLGTAAPAAATEHLLSVRIYDRFENMSSIKTVVR